jgi:hypothetical protein
MLKKTIKFTDYFGEERTQDFYFNLNKSELIEMNFTTTGGMQHMLEEIQNSRDNKRIYELFKSIVLKAYGEKSSDGYRFIKSPELSEAFSQTEAFNELIVEMFSDPGAAAKFMMGIVPPDLATEAKKHIAAGEISGVSLPEGV